MEHGLSRGCERPSHDAQGPQGDDMSEQYKAQLCKGWLQDCLAMGWKNSDMPFLCDLFWLHEGWKTYRPRKVR